MIHQAQGLLHRLLIARGDRRLVAHALACHAQGHVEIHRLVFGFGLVKGGAHAGEHLAELVQDVPEPTASLAAAKAKRGEGVRRVVLIAFALALVVIVVGKGESESVTHTRHDT